MNPLVSDPRCRATGRRLLSRTGPCLYPRLPRLAGTTGVARAGVVALLLLLALCWSQASEEVQARKQECTAKGGGGCTPDCAEMAQQEWNYLDLAKIRATLIRQVNPPDPPPTPGVSEENRTREAAPAVAQIAGEDAAAYARSGLYGCAGGHDPLPPDRARAVQA